MFTVEQLSKIGIPHTVWNGVSVGKPITRVYFRKTLLELLEFELIRDEAVYFRYKDRKLAVATVLQYATERPYFQVGDDNFLSVGSGPNYVKEDLKQLLEAKVNELDS